MRTAVLAGRRKARRRHAQFGSVLVVVLIVIVLIGTLLGGTARRIANLRTEVRRIEDRQLRYWETNAPGRVQALESAPAASGVR